MRSAITIMDSVPEPIHTISNGPNAIFGRAFKTTRYGSSILQSVSLHHIKTAIKVPMAVPNMKPIHVSYMVTPMCMSRLSSRHSLTIVLTMPEGLLVIKGSIMPVRAATSHKAKNTIRIMYLVNRIKSCFLLCLRKKSSCACDIFIFHQHSLHKVPATICQTTHLLRGRFCAPTNFCWAGLYHVFSKSVQDVLRAPPLYLRAILPR